MTAALSPLEVMSMIGLAFLVGSFFGATFAGRPLDREYLRMRRETAELIRVRLAYEEKLIDDVRSGRIVLSSLADLAERAPVYKRADERGE